ncbi:MAG: SPFH domain-containing protein [Armatimonadetes bacterium]|nr:SPFH domain-containing protein [Armatimonadota bacterium]
MQLEREVRATNGWLMLFVTILMYAAGIAGIPWLAAQDNAGTLGAGQVVAFISVWLLAGLLSGGFFIVEPNGSKVLLLFGSYKGTVKNAGFHWVIPLMLRRKISLRARTLNGEKLKVNDLAGNPVEIAVIIVWQVTDTYAASFEVDNYDQYVALQSETALRHNASAYPYDAEDDSVSLRRNADEVSQHLLTEIQERVSRAGVTVLEARLSHLAYAPEIAGAMLRRQQAAAVIAARQKIVDGAVGMVELALKRMEDEGVIHLDDERKAAMISNLMVVLCSEHAATPVLNTGTLYS